MAEGTNSKEAAQEATAEDQQFIIERVYVKDISYTHLLFLLLILIVKRN